MYYDSVLYDVFILVVLYHKVIWEIIIFNVDILRLYIPINITMANLGI